MIPHVSARLSALARTAACGLALSAAGGCSTWLSSGPADLAASGVRYHLPQPMIEVVPQPDGSVTVKPIYVPDPRQVYYVRAGSLLSKYTLDVQTDGRGLLKSVAFAPDSSQVAAKAATAAGEIGKARVEALKAAREKQAAAEAEERKAVQAASRDAAVASAKVKALRAQLDDARAAGSASAAAIEAELRAALVAEAEANARLDNLGGAFAAARSGTGSLSLPAEGKKFPTAYGPVLFVVEQRNTLDTNGDNKPDDQPTVRLRALAPQRAFDTSTFARVEEMPAAAGTEALTLELEGDRFLTAVGGTFPPAFAKIVGGKAPSIAGTPKLRNLDKDMDVAPSLVANVEVVEDGTRLRYQLKPGTPPAEAYSLIIDLKRADGGPTRDASIIFGVR